MLCCHNQPAKCIKTTALVDLLCDIVASRLCVIPSPSQTGKTYPKGSILTCVNSFCFIPVSHSLCPYVLPPFRWSSCNIIIYQWTRNPCQSVILSNLHETIKNDKYRKEYLLQCPHVMAITCPQRITRDYGLVWYTISEPLIVLVFEWISQKCSLLTL